MSLNRVIIDKLNESSLNEDDKNTVRYVDRESDSFIEVTDGRISNVSDGGIIDIGPKDKCQFVGFVKVADTSYFGLVENNKLYMYSFDNGIPFEFLPEGDKKLSEGDRIDLGDRYVMKDYGDCIQISSIHPYDNTDYSFAKSFDGGNTFTVFDPDNKSARFEAKSQDEALAKMKEIDATKEARIDRS